MASTAKEIAKRIKAKGLQKLKWYCQMCGKQCRDENGFRNHMTSEGHLRLMAVFRERSDQFVDEFSRNFERGYLEVLKRKGARINANNVYQEYIQDRHHVHMNATQWSTLAQFVQHLGRSGMATVEEEGGKLFVRYIDVETRNRIEQARKHDENKRDIQQRSERELQEQIKRAAVNDVRNISNEPVPIVHELSKGCNNNSKISLNFVKQASSVSMKPKLSLSKHASFSAESSSNAIFDENFNSAASLVSTDHIASNRKRQLTAVESLIEENERIKMKKIGSRKNGGAVSLRDRSSNVDHDFRSFENGKKAASSTKLPLHSLTNRCWLTRGLRVRIVSKQAVDAAYYKAFGTIQEANSDDRTADIQLDSGDVIHAHQHDLDTVIPDEAGARLLILTGPHMGADASLISKDAKQYLCTAKLLSNGEVLSDMDFMDLSSYDPAYLCS